MEAGNIIKTSGVIGRMAGRRSSSICRFSPEENWYKPVISAVSANEGDAYPLGALAVGTLVNNLEVQPGKGAECIRAAGDSIIWQRGDGVRIFSTVSCKCVYFFRNKRRFAAEGERHGDRPASFEAAGSGEGGSERVDASVLRSADGPVVSLRCWRPAWWRWDACPTSTTTNASSVKPAATAGWAFDRPAACGKGRAAGRDGRLNRCPPWRATSTCPQSLLFNCNKSEWKGERQDMFCVQKIKNFI